MKYLQIAVEWNLDGTLSRIVGRYCSSGYDIIDEETMLSGKMPVMELTPEEIGLINTGIRWTGGDPKDAIEAVFRIKFQEPVADVGGTGIQYTVSARARNWPLRRKRYIEWLAHTKKSLWQWRLESMGHDLSLIDRIDWLKEADRLVFVPEREGGIVPALTYSQTGTPYYT